MLFDISRGTILDYRLYANTGEHFSQSPLFLGTAMIEVRVADFVNSGHKFFRITEVNRHTRGCKGRPTGGA